MWPWYSAIAMICFAAMQLVFRELGRRGVNLSAVLLVVFALAALLYLLHVRVTRAPVPATATVLALLAGTAVLSYIGNHFSVRAVATAPNPGYALALVSLQGAVVTLIAAALFGASLSWIKLVGVALCCVGVALIVI
jgi:drug/metabolite transporter (DMT)-like permease